MSDTTNINKVRINYGAVRKSAKRRATALSLSKISKKEKPLSEFDRGEYSSAEVGEKSISFVVYFVD